jgi:hypothetical protein
MASNPLIGTWRLLSWENRSVEDGQVSYPLGEDAAGYIIYNEDGYMFVAIMAPHRLRFAPDDLPSATKEEQALAEEDAADGEPVVSGSQSVGQYLDEWLRDAVEPPSLAGRTRSVRGLSTST